MSRPAFWVAFASALGAALALRLADPDLRPMHHDEANQAVRFGYLLESGEYVYDRTDHHGPTLYYLTLPFAWMRGQHSLAALDERTLRMVPAVFGAATLLLFLPLRRALGAAAIVSAAALAAVSPFFTYYSRFYIQEPMFVFFVLAFVIALGLWATRRTPGAAIAAGLAGGFAYATKETSIIVLPAAVVACLLAQKTGTLNISQNETRAHGNFFYGRVRFREMLSVPVFLMPPLVLFTSLFRNPDGFVDSFSAFSIYFSRGLDPGPHVQPWYGYLQMLGWSRSEGLLWSEAAVLTLALVGIAHAVAVRKTSFWPVYLAAYSLLTAAIFSLIRYKTPWNALPFYVGFLLLAGIGVSALFARTRRPIARAAVAAGLAAAIWHLGAQNVRANFRYAADPRNPYVYAHTSTDYLKLIARIRDVAAVHPDGRGILVKVAAAPHEQWPLPWYLRDFSHVGYWQRASEAAPLDAAPIVVASAETAAAVESALGDRYLSEFYGLRPGVLLTVYIERGLWDRFLRTRQ